MYQIAFCYNAIQKEAKQQFPGYIQRRQFITCGHRWRDPDPNRTECADPSSAASMGRIAMNKEYVPEWDQPATRTEESTENKSAVAGVKQIVTIRLDVDMLEWFKGAGPGYQTRINQVLREYMEANRVRAQGEQQ
jgi:uncharacterized protein (DUF4415 family)